MYVLSYMLNCLRISNFLCLVDNLQCDFFEFSVTVGSKITASSFVVSNNEYHILRSWILELPNHIIKITTNFGHELVVKLWQENHL